VSDLSQGPGWWLATDGRWYPPERHPTYSQQRTHVAPPAEPNPQSLSVPPPGTPPGWYRDALDPTSGRYWDGVSWGTETRPIQTPAPAPSAPPPPTTALVSAPAPKTPVATAPTQSPPRFQEPRFAPLIATNPIMEKRTYASAMSYVGVTRRTTAWVRKVGSTSAAAAYFAWSAAMLFLLFMYVFLIGWYFVVFVLFGFFTFPFRLIRRGQRKQAHVQQTQLATMQAMLIRQQQSLGQNPPSQVP
jgi:hypothetical protein